ncbi:MAG: hypothetical protein P4L51_02105 [Puia sp.]|nr:hypothetical protein [Puia sp.]
MKKHLFLSAFLCYSLIAANAQNKQADSQNKLTDDLPQYDKSTLGFGIGFDYGGFGGNYCIFPQQNIGIFGGVGYAIAGLGYNFGLKFRLTPRHKFNPFVMAMYGYNAAIAVSNSENFVNASNMNKLFYGPTAGIGFDYGNYRTRKGYLSVALTIPFRSPDVNNYIDQLKNQGVTFRNGLSAVGFSIGYKFVMF